MLIAGVCLAVDLRAEDAARESAYKELLSGALKTQELSALARAQFDLQRPETTEFLLQKLARPNWKGEPVAFGFAELMSTRPAETFEWALDTWSRLTPLGKSNAINAMARFDAREVDDLLVFALADQAPAVNQIARTHSELPEEDGPFVDLRVCDHAYNVLLGRLNETKAAKESSPALTLISEEAPVEKRDRLIRTMKDYWSLQKDVLLKERSSWAAARPAISRKLDATKARLGK